MSDVLVDVPRGLRLSRAGELEVRAPAWLVQGLIERDSLACLFGDPACGKTFTALDVACSIATGSPFHGLPTQQGAVAYLCGEGHAGLARRLKAWQLHHGPSLADAPLFVSRGPVELIDDADSVISAIQAVGGADLVVVDTVARCFGAGDESATKDMSAFVGALDRIRSAFQCTVLAVHHSGHGDKSRARGAIALRAAVDAEYRQDRDVDGLIRLEATKMKDASPPDPLAFKLHPVGLGIESEGVEVSSAVLRQADYSQAQTPRRGKWQAVALRVLHDLHARHRANVEADGRDPVTARVSIHDWRHACEQAGMPKQRFYEARQALDVREEHGFVWPTQSGSGSPVPSGS